MVRSSLIFSFFFSLSVVCFSQDGKFAIFFKDKAATTFSVDNPIEFLSQKSIDRRTKNGVSPTEQDFPVNSSYVLELKNLGADVLHTSRWMNCAIVQLDDGELDDILLLSFVSGSEYLSPAKAASGGRIKKINRKKDSQLGLVNQVQSSMIGLDDMHMDGVLGEGIVIGVFDSGFKGVDVADPFKSIFTDNRLKYTLDLVGKSGNVFQYDDHGTEVLSVMAANLSGSYTGGAPKATYQLYVTEDVDSEYRIEEYNWLVAAEKADSAGVDIINSSLGYNLFDDESMDYTVDQLDGNTAIVSRAAALAAEKGIMVVVSAGNDGNSSWKLVNPPADANGVLTVGSVTSTGNLSNFSSVGPTSDGRIKPDVVALGSSVSVIKSNGTTGFTSGTSVATPLIASLAAGLMQTFPELAVAELYSLITSSGTMSGSPDNQRGYGIPHYSVAKGILNGEELPTPTSAVNLYPNPTTQGLVRIEIDVAVGQKAAIYIYSLHGQLVFQSEGNITYANNPLDLDVSALADGLYIVKVETEGVVKTIRLVKL